MKFLRIRKYQYALLFSLIVFLVCAVLSIQPKSPQAEAQQLQRAYPVSDLDWDYWTSFPDMSAIPSGNVGIGTATPGAKLEVDGTLAVSDQITSTAAQGTAPLDVSSTTVCPNLNADMLDGYSSSSFASKTRTSLAAGGDTKTFTFPHCHVFQIVAADHYGQPGEIAFLHCIENDHRILYMGFDSAGNLVKGSASLWSSNTLISLNGGGITLSTQGDGSSTLVFSSTYMDCTCTMTW